MLENLINIFISVASSLAASFLFLIFYLKRKVPKISISNYICKQEIDGECNYVFKFVNNTKAEIYDVRIEPSLYKPFGDRAGQNMRGKDIKLKDGFMSYIPPKKVNDKHNLHASRVRTTEKIEDMWTDDSSFIRLTVIAKHALSGFNKVYFIDFNSKECITTKKFNSGDQLDVS